MLSVRISDCGIKKHGDRSQEGVEKKNPGGETPGNRVGSVSVRSLSACWVTRSNGSQCRDKKNKC